MRAMTTFLIMAGLGAILAIGAQMTAIPAGAAFMLGMAYLIVVSLFLSTRGARA
jgi:hypothetical protein